MNMPKESLLKNIPLFSAFSKKELKTIASIAEEKTYAKGKIILKEGKTGDALYVIISGEVAIEKQPLTKPRESVVIMTLKEGNFFG